MNIISQRDQKSIKKPLNLKKHIFLNIFTKDSYSRNSNYSKTDTGITLILPANSKGFITSKFRGDEIFEINSEKQ